MTHTEIINAVISINTEMHTNTGNEYMYLTYSTNGWSSSVDFLGHQIWDEHSDSREYNEETDEYEPIETCLRRELRGEIEKIGGSLSH